MKKAERCEELFITKLSLKMYKILCSDYYIELKISVFSFKELSNFCSVKFKTHAKALG